MGSVDADESVEQAVKGLAAGDQVHRSRLLGPHQERDLRLLVGGERRRGKVDGVSFSEQPRRLEPRFAAAVCGRSCRGLRFRPVVR